MYIEKMQKVIFYAILTNEEQNESLLSFCPSEGKILYVVIFYKSLNTSVGGRVVKYNRL